MKCSCRVQWNGGMEGGLGDSPELEEELAKIAGDPRRRE